VASRAAVLASLLPANANRDKFMHTIGIHGDPIAAKQRIDDAKKNQKHLGPNPYGYKRAFTYAPNQEDKNWIEFALGRPPDTLSILDPTAGGGSIPFEARRTGFTAISNDLNSVSALVLKATTEWPEQYGSDLLEDFNRLASDFIRRAYPKYEGIFPPEPEGTRIEGYLWARTITCPYCSGLVPLSPNWRLAPNGTGVKLKPRTSGGPHKKNRHCDFEIVETAEQQSQGTVSWGKGACPFPDCERVIDGDEIKRQAQAGEMGEQLYAIAFKQLAATKTKTGKIRDKWVRYYRAPRPEDNNSTAVAARLAENLSGWEIFDIIPNDKFPEDSNDDRPIQYGMPRWRDMFSPRQLLCHGISVEIFREMLESDKNDGNLNEIRQASYGYLAISLDKLISYNCIMCAWNASREVVAPIFDRHDFSFTWSYAEMAPLITGTGYDWAIGQVSKSIRELVALIRPGDDKSKGKLFNTTNDAHLPVTITCKSADGLDHIENGSVDAVIMDPPYYDNVMYAELSDFFYVWLKRTAGHVFPELFRSRLTDKENEAIANPARFRGEKGASVLAKRDYRERMARIFAECRRVLKPDGILTLLFTHKATGAWDALTTGLVKAGFVITASWPINTEAPNSMHIKDKAAANSTIFLACRPRTKAQPAKEARELPEQTLIARAQEMGEARRALFLQALQPRSKSLADLTALDGPGAFALLKTHEFAYDEKAVSKWLRRGEPSGLERLRELRPLLAELAPFDPKSIEAAVAGFCEARGIGLGKAAQPLRVAVTGGASSPPLGITLAILGQTETTARLDRCLAEIGGAQNSARKDSA